MSVLFEIPDWLMDTSASQAPPDTSDVDPHRVEDLVNRFIAGKQDALFTAPDAYYRNTGRDAVDDAPGILDRLNVLKQATLDAAGGDGTRFVLGPRLDAHLDDASDGIDRHVAARRDELTRQIISERQRLVQRAATLEHNNDDKLAGLAEAHASAAQELARMNGEPEAPAMDAARSAIWHAAIDQRLAKGSGPQAITLFDQVRNRLTPDDQLSLDGPLQVARDDQAANQWIAGQTGTDGLPLQDRAAADPNLSPDAKLIIRAKLDAQDSPAESKRVATVKSLDDQMADTIRTLATAPNAYKTGTLFRIARAYDPYEPDKAAATGRLATQEAVLTPFAQMGVDKQQRLIDSLPDGELRNTAIAIQRRQADSFARDPFAAGAALYPEVGPPVPINDIRGRIRQARQVEELRHVPVIPFSANEVGEMQRTLAQGSEQEKQAVWSRLAALPDDVVEDVARMLWTKPAPETMSDAVEEAPHPGQQYAQVTTPSIRRGGLPDLTPGQQLLLGEYQYLTTRIATLEPQNRLAASIYSPGWAPNRQDVEQAREEYARVLQRKTQFDPGFQKPTGPSLQFSYGDPARDAIRPTLEPMQRSRGDASDPAPRASESTSVESGPGRSLVKSEYPPHPGFMGRSVIETLKPGTRIDRYGSPGGRFLAPEGTPFTARGMPADHELRPRMVYEVVEPFEVEGGVAQPAFGQRGFGWQYFLGNRTVQDLIDSGHLRPVK